MISRYITLEELMREFKPEPFLKLHEVLGLMDGLHRGLRRVGDALKTNMGSIPLDDETRSMVLTSFRKAKALCDELGLRYSSQAAERAIYQVSLLIADHDLIHNSVIALADRVRDEMDGRLFYVVEPDKQHFATDHNLFGEQVTARFPSSYFDIQEAGQNLMFDRWTAAVFHLGRVAEIATVAIGKRVGYHSPKEGLREVLTYMDNGLEKARKDYPNADPLFKGDIEFLSSVTVQMHAVNQAWRQRVAHLDKKYTEEEATRIWDTTKRLMQQLATRLSEEAA